ncbi:MAG TPA: ATPase [Micromonosporaceae bacterium]|nr:ATPase [Micromonosporaceae bacterium]
MGLVWGRKRVGKTALIGEFAKRRKSIIHTGRGVGLAEELRTLTGVIPAELDLGGRDLSSNPFTGWADVLTTLARAAAEEPLLLVLDEFPELRASDPAIEQTLRAVWDQVRSRTKLRLLLCGSAVRTMQAIAEERSALHGRFDLRLPVHPFRPHEAALMLRQLAPADRAMVWGICGGTPLYLSWWDQSADVAHNLRKLACSPGALLRTEAELVLATDGVAGGLAKQVLGAIAVGKNRHSEIVDSVTGDRQVSRVLDDLEKVRLVERVVPVTEDPRARTGRTMYRIADNYLAFWLSLLERYSGEIDRGLGTTIAKLVHKRLDDHMGPRYEEAFRSHLRRLAAAGEFGDEVAAVGPFWTRGGSQVEIDAVVLSGIPEMAVAVGECKWQQRVNAASLRTKLVENARALPRVVTEPILIIGAREAVVDSDGVRSVTAGDIFG